MIKLIGLWTMFVGWWVVAALEALRGEWLMVGIYAVGSLGWVYLLRQAYRERRMAAMVRAHFAEFLASREESGPTLGAAGGWCAPSATDD
jgi:hypothetical protein